MAVSLKEKLLGQLGQILADQTLFQSPNHQSQSAEGTIGECCGYFLCLHSLQLSLDDNLHLAMAETRSLNETLAERDERIRRLERLADEYRSRLSQVNLLCAHLSVSVWPSDSDIAYIN